MKKTVLYIVMFLTGILIGSFVYEAYGDKMPYMEIKSSSLLAINSPKEERPTDLNQSYSAQVGKILVISGVIKEAYKNKQNEVVLYIKDRNIPVLLNCTLYHSDKQIKRAIRLGETVSLKGKFTEIGEEMYFEKCKIIFRSPN
jgi:hypothetical protein